MTKLLLPCCLLLALTVGTSSRADDQESEPPPEHEAPAASAGTAAEPSRTRDNTSFEVFVPSEQISEDLPVPFPVDI